MHTTNVRRSRLPILFAALLTILLAGCGETAAPVEETPPPAAYQVRYFFGKDLLQTQTVTEGQYPIQLELSLPGLRFTGWVDAAGSEVQPEHTAASEDADYFAAVLPLLNNHVPYLFPDENGFLRPDAPLTHREMTDALYALAYPSAEGYLPELPANDEPMLPETFREALLAIFPAAQADSALEASQGGDTITRREAAVILNTLLGRGKTETVTLRRDACRAPDVSPDAPDYWDLLEASVSHTVDSWGEPWQRCTIPARYAAGFLRMNGRLYYIGSDGVMRTDAEQDGFEFGPDGVYTSGSPALDAYVVDILGTIMAEHPGAAPIDLLRAAYNYSRDSFTYLRKAPIAFGATDWENDAAEEMFSTLRGNCYNYAAAFRALARGLGYDARAYSGTISDAPHGWVEITIDGTDYMFDPELEMAGLERNGYAADRFMMTRQYAANFGVYVK